jgi:glutamate-ammonia-ligase adenylyltransferase
VAGPPSLDVLVRRSADAARVGLVLDRLGPARVERLDADPALARAAVAVAAASGWMGRLLVADGAALDILAELDDPVPDDDVAEGRTLARWWRREQLRIAARDLTDRDPLETTMGLLARGAGRVLGHALRLADAGHLAVVALGKAGGNELNYASDVDVVLVGPGHDDGGEREAARRTLTLARAALRVDVDLRPGGRDGALVRTVDGYRAHWDRWAEPWERQALLKARALAGDPGLGARFVAAAGEALWTRSLDADALHAVRAMKARTERHALATDGPDDVKRTPGGIRDIEFSAQLLQLVHGPLDPALRVRGTLPALTALADGGYVDDGDARWLRASYRLLRRVEHGVQLDEGRQVHALPAARDDRERLARVLGLSDRPQSTAVADLDREVAACRQTVRSIHERLYFRPLLESFTRVDAPLAPEAAAARLAAFGFADADRTRQAVTELTAGLTRSSRLMAALLPLVLDWLSAAPDPDQGLLALRTLVAADARAVATACRESPETARRLSLLAGTSPLLVRGLVRAPDLLATLGAPPEDDRSAVVRRVRAAGARGDDPATVRSALRRAVRREMTRIGIGEVLDGRDPPAVGSELATVAHAAVDVALDVADPQVPFAVLALGRLAGGELAYASDLDLLLVHDGHDEAGREEAARAGEVVRRVLLGSGPADRVYDVDLDLRPGGRSGALVPSREAVVAHLTRWVEPWQRLALTWLRPLSGDADLAARLLAEADPLIWRTPDEADRRAVRRVKARAETERVPPGEDARFHLKLGPGGLADIELTVALLLWEHGLREPATSAGIAALAAAGHLTAGEAGTLEAAHAFCERTRNRWTLVAGRGHDALPGGDELATLARALDTTAPTLRDDYLRVTRRARRVVERHFYRNA